MRITIFILSGLMIATTFFAEKSYAQFGNQDQKEGTYKVEGAGGYSSEETQIPKSKKGVKFSDAYPEEINSKNYPNVIDTFDYPDIEIKDMVTVMAELTGKRFIIGSDVKGKITIVSKEPITVAEAYKAFLSALRVNKLTIVPSGKFLNIVREADAPKNPVETYTGEYFPDADQVITKIIKLKYIPASELDKSLRSLYSRAGDLKVYEPTNSIILTDYGSNVEKFVRIIGELDVPGFEEKMEVIPIKHAKSKDIADLVNKIINKGENSSGSSVPRFRRSTSKSDSSGKGSVNLSYVTSDERTNSLIVLGNKAGISKARDLIKKLDFGLNEEEEGGVFVYYVKHNDAEEISKTLGGIAEESQKAQTEAAKATGSSSTPRNLPPTVAVAKTAAQVFGGEVKIKADKNTNSLIITASSQDYKIVKSILSKIDIPRDQVFVETVIMEMDVEKRREVGLDIANVIPAGPATVATPATSVAVQGIFGNDGGGIGDLLVNPASALGSLGGILTFGGGKDITVNLGSGPITIPSINGLVRLIQQTKMGNVLSTPKIMAMDNEESELEVGREIALGIETQSNAGGQVSSPRRKKVAMKLTITPSISPDSEAVRLELAQTVQDVVTPGDENTDITDKSLKTNIVVPNGDTAVLGGLTNNKTSRTVAKVPLLGDIPILGWLFRSNSVTNNKNNLMLFITPRIIRNPAQNKALVKQQLEQRLDFIKRELNGIDPFGGKVDEISKIKTPLNDDSGWDEDLPEELKEEPAMESY